MIFLHGLSSHCLLTVFKPTFCYQRLSLFLYSAFNFEFREEISSEDLADRERIFKELQKCKCYVLLVRRLFRDILFLNRINRTPILSRLSISLSSVLKSAFLWQHF